MTHSRHPSIQDAGLADGCERCGELAADPFDLDDESLSVLVARTRQWMRDEAGSFPRSENEGIAMRSIERLIVRVNRLRRVERMTPPA